MSAGSKFARAFSLRDKKGSNNKITTDNDLFSLDEGSKKLSKDEQQKIQEIQTRFSRLGNNNVPESRIQYALRSRSAQGDVGEATRLLLLYEDSIAGVLHRYDSSVKMLGAENREKSTCWLDSLLFAMFAKTDVFEAVLHQQYEDEERKKLVEGLRLWVNMLRSGKLITTDIVSMSAANTRFLILNIDLRPENCNKQSPNAVGQTQHIRGSKTHQKLSISSPTNYHYLYSRLKPIFITKARKMLMMTTSSSPNACSM